MRSWTTGSDFSLVRKTVPIGVALKEVVDQTVNEAGLKWLNPIYQLCRRLTGIKNFTAFQRKLAENGQTIRKVVYDYVLKRKSGEVKSKVPDGADLLSLFLENQ